ncbi:LacI family transcriptional regulator [Tenacibaculum sp. 190524A05c]|uniref:LacI family DNA-binding transcriptional regulator n=1 Tax=Tenacibaculum platacis TaxID=3137852 RepID=UPI0031FA5EF8
MGKRLTLKDIAKEFNVSIATVSKAIQDKHDISSDLKKKILAYALENNYVPNQNALKLRGKQTKTIGVVIPSILNLFFAKVFAGIEKVASEHGYNLITCISNDSLDKEKIAIDMMVNGEVDGIIISVAKETQIKKDYKHFFKAMNTGVKLTMFDRVTDDVDCDKVIVDDFQGAYNATEYFVKTGCSNIALLSFISETSVGEYRIQGYKEALENNHIAINKNLIIEVKEHDVDETETLLTLTLGSRKVDAILCLEETSAAIALDTIKRLGYKIPEDISIIAFTNGIITKYTTPKITTVSQHGVFMGEQSMTYLLNRLQGDHSQKEKEFTTKVIKTSLIQRQTTKKLS